MSAASKSIDDNTAAATVGADLSVLRVVHVIDTLNVGGAEMLLPELCRYQDAAAIDSTVIALRPGRDTDVARVLNDLGIRVEIVATQRRRQMLDLRRIGRLKNALVAGDYQLVHTHLRVATIFGAIAARLAGLPVVTTLHNVRTDVGTGVVNRIKDFLETQVLRRSVSIAIACGPTVAQSNATRVHPTQQQTVANPMREIPVIEQAQRQALRDQWLGTATGPLLLAVGRLTRQKGFDILFDAFAQLSERHPDARLLVVGEGEERDALEQQRARLGLAQKITMPGVRDDIPALMRSADAFIMPSRWEGLPVALLEAMAAQLPVIATTVGDIPWTAGDTVVMIEPESSEALSDALLTLASDPDSARELAVRAQARVEQRHNPVAWVKALRKVYDQAIAAG